MSRRWLYPSAAAFGACLLGCAPESVGDVDASGEATMAIVDGSVDSDTTAVMALVNTQIGSLCTGTLIAPNALLTARHCVSSIESNTDNGVNCQTDGVGSLWQVNGFVATSATELSPPGVSGYGVAKIIGLEGAAPVPPHSTDAGLCGLDAAIVILDENVPASEAVPLLPRLEPVVAGETYSVLGYGAVDGGGSDAGTRRRRDDLVVDCTQTDCTAHPEFGDQVHVDEWIGGGAICSGDSGGPAIAAEDGAVIGVASRATTDCSLSVHEHVPSYGQWLKDSVALASGMGLYEPPAWTAGATVDPKYGLPVGEVCDDGASCPSGICASDPQGSFCSRECDEVGPCPEGWSCGDGICLRPEPPTTPTFKRAPKDGCSVAGSRGSVARGEAWLGWWAVVVTLLLRRRRWRRASGDPGS